MGVEAAWQKGKITSLKDEILENIQDGDDSGKHEIVAKTYQVRFDFKGSSTHDGKGLGQVLELV